MDCMLDRWNSFIGSHTIYDSDLYEKSPKSHACFFSSKNFSSDIWDFLLIVIFWDIIKSHPDNRWASSRENLSSGFATREYKNQTGLVSFRDWLKSWYCDSLTVASIGTNLSKERKQRRWSYCADAQADLHLCCSHIAWTGFLMMRLKW